jgi:hypothetical protein
MLINEEDFTIYINNKKITNLYDWLKTDEADKLRLECDYSDCGERIVDNEVRTCSYFKVDEVLFRNHIEFNEGQLEDPVLLEYSEGSFFASHSDTQHGMDHMGNMMILGPKEYSGGTLIVDGKRHISDKNNWKSVFIPMDTEHSITKVTTGKRLALKFKVVMPLDKHKKIYVDHLRKIELKHHNRSRRRRFTNGRKD